MIRYGSVCSGVEAASLAWEPLGWEPAFFAEVEPFPAAVLMQRFGATKPLRPLDPADAHDKDDLSMRRSWLNAINKLPDGGSIPNVGDFTKIRKDDYVGTIDLLVGGTPCQDLSYFGKRKGFDGKRSVLAVDFVRVAFEQGVRWIVWENVPGALSSNDGQDFSAFLSLLTGYDIETHDGGSWGNAGICQNATPERFGIAWRVLDPPYTRTHRFPHGIPHRRRRVLLVGYFGDWTRAAKVLFHGESLERGAEKNEAESCAEDFFQPAQKGRRNKGISCYGFNGDVGESFGGISVYHEVSPTLLACHEQDIFILDEKAGVATFRHQTPIETERLMGFPDNHTRISWNGLHPEQCPDKPRYKACGNSMAVNVMEWIGERIDKLEKEENGK